MNNIDPMNNMLQREVGRQRVKEMAELQALRYFVRDIACQEPEEPIGQRQSNKERAEDLVDQWSILP